MTEGVRVLYLQRVPQTGLAEYMKTRNFLSILIAVSSLSIVTAIIIEAGGETEVPEIPYVPEWNSHGWFGLING